MRKTETYGGYFKKRTLRSLQIFNERRVRRKRRERIKT